MPEGGFSCSQFLFKEETENDNQSLYSLITTMSPNLTSKELQLTLY